MQAGSAGWKELGHRLIPVVDRLARQANLVVFVRLNGFSSCRMVKAQPEGS